MYVWYQEKYVVLVVLSCCKSAIELQRQHQIAPSQSSCHSQNVNIAFSRSTVQKRFISPGDRQFLWQLIARSYTDRAALIGTRHLQTRAGNKLATQHSSAEDYNILWPEIL